MTETWRTNLQAGIVIPACPLALHDDRSWSPRHQRAVLRYYLDAGAGGVAVGVHTTQFEIREPQHGLFEPVLAAAAECLNQHAGADFVRVAGICGQTEQAVQEADLAATHGYHCGLLSLAAFKDASNEARIEHCRAVAEVLPVFGFYLQPAVGGCILDFDFWQRFCEIENVVAIKIAAFNRYQTWDVVRAVMESGRDDIALYTGNDDNIINDLLTPFEHDGQRRFISGGLLGQWAVWTKAAVDMLKQIQQVRASDSVPSTWLTRNMQLTDANAVLFDAANHFAGCIPGINEVLRRQALLPSAACLNPDEVLSPGQADEIDRITSSYPQLVDDRFVSENLDRWLDND